MNNIKSLMSVVFLTGALGFCVPSAGAEAVISKDVLADGSYCHTKFESIPAPRGNRQQPVAPGGHRSSAHRRDESEISFRGINSD